MSIEKQIMNARPRLRLVSPLAAAIFLGYAVTNVALGVGLFMYSDPTPNATFSVITNYTPFKLWGLVFIGLGLFKFYTYAKNDWKKMRLALVGGLLVKSIWAFALFIRFLSGGSIVLLVIWLFFAYVQAVTYIHFIPNERQRT